MTDRKKILIVCRGFFPQISPRSFRATELAKELARKGHDVTVFVPSSGIDYTSFEEENNLKLRYLGVLRWGRIEPKGSGLLNFFMRVLRRVALLFFEWPDIELFFKVSNSLRDQGGYDILISIAVPHSIHWGIAKVRSETNRIADTWIADCGDPFMGDTTDSFRKLFYFKYFEKWFCRKADFITVPFEGARSAYYPEFRDKIRVIPQGFNLDNQVKAKYEKRFDYPVFAYAGAFIQGKRDPELLLEYLGSINRNFRFIVYTHQPDFLLHAKSTLGDKLEIRERIPRNELLEVLSGMDFLINLDNNVQTQLPSKLIDYAIAGRPVLNIGSGDDFATLLEFLDGNYKGKMDLGSLERYDIKVVAQDFIALHNTINNSESGQA